MRWIAPQHVSDVTLSIGPIPVVDGEIKTPDDLSEGDRQGLAVNGFVPAPAIVERAPIPAGSDGEE